MKTNQKTQLAIGIGYFLLFILTINTPQAQSLPKGVFQKEVYLHLDSTADTIVYLEVRDADALKLLGEKLLAENYPISIIKKPVLDPFFELILQYESQLDDCQLLSHHYSTLDSIQQEKELELKKVIRLQEDRVNNYKKLNEDLSQANTQLNSLLSNTLEIAKDGTRHRVKKQWLTAILGAGVGFSIAGIITSFK
ncbi:MAG: hypothetical protein SFV55_20405 [Haliscomenobacter sp.]|uniref:hypothetical protein n=1 Tax=Haliscomenobacter sp. TaxID=2717303 RepID=UPI0029B78763|nr:hypothetical protein [Haliscomenobacter sp.]MDX2070803.1 hypothetical protein [Haliscomenobacter sp.]